MIKRKNLLRRGLSALICAAILLASAAIPSAALGGNWKGVLWEIKDGVLTVSGSDIPDSSASAVPPWQKFHASVTSIVVGNGVTVIGERAFEDMKSAVSVDMGRSVSVGRMAFSGCASIKEISLHEGIFAVEDFAFAECLSLERITLPSTLHFFGIGVLETTPSLQVIESASVTYPVTDGLLINAKTGEAVRYPEAASATSVTLPATVTTVGIGAFRDCVSLVSVKMPAVTQIGDGAFFGCTSLLSADMPAVEGIGRAAFLGCSSLERITLPATLKSLADGVFKNCSALRVAEFLGNAPSAGAEIFLGTSGSFTLLVPDDGHGWGGGDTWQGYPLLRHGKYGGAWENLTWALDTSTGILSVSGVGEMPDLDTPADAPWYLYRRAVREIRVTGLTSVGANAFRYSSAVAVTLDKTVRTVGAWAFSGCSSLETVVGEGVAILGECAFFGCGSLRTLSAGDVVSIGKQCFSACENLYTLSLKSTVAPTLGEYAFDGTDVSVIHPRGATGFDKGDWAKVSSEAFLLGDADGNGTINLLDVAQLLRHIAGWDAPVARISSDFNGDGRLNLIDASAIMKHIAGWV